MLPKRRFRLVLQTLSVLTVLSASGPQTLSQVVNGTVAGMTDKDAPAPPEYAASGGLTTSAAVPLAPVNGPPFNIPPFPGPDGVVNWKFAVRHKASKFEDVKASGVQLLVGGQHVTAPHAGENAPNILPEIASKDIDIPVGKTAMLSTFGGIPHGTAGHMDFYAASGDVKYTVVGAVGNLSGNVKVGAFHQDIKPPSFAVGATLKDALGSSVSFNAATGMLSFTPGPIDGLNVTGLEGGIDPLYATDPMLDAMFHISDLPYLGIASDGRFRFGAGTVDVTTPSGLLGLTASFDAFLLGSTTSDTALTTYALLTSGTTYDAGDVPSAWLQDFVTDQLFHALPTSSGNAFAERGLDFTFLTANELAALTNNFTTSAFNVPASLAITGNGSVPEPGSVAFIAAALLCSMPLFRPGFRRRKEAQTSATKRHTPRIVVSLFALAGLPLPRTAMAVTIVPDFSMLGRVTQDGTPGGVDVTDLVKRDIEAASMWWEQAILKNFTLMIKFTVGVADPTNTAETGQYVEDAITNYITQASTAFDVPSHRNWYFDPTPHENEEFNMMEYMDSHGVVVGREGNAIAGGPAAGKWDFVAVMKHEIGHALGLARVGTLYQAETADGDIDIDPALMSPLDAIPVTPGGAHFDGTVMGGLFNHALMAAPGFGAGMRAIQSDADILAVASVYNLSKDDIVLNPHAVPEPSATYILLVGVGIAFRTVRRRHSRRATLQHP